ncbi:hypothetical protein AVO41_09315 [Thiomicrospira sp. WB1]|nr:hypothetical protein AVO41_09315 [Thiomicrospira sp. WB1]
MHSNRLNPLTKAMAVALMTSAAATAQASNNLAGGVWFNYENVNDTVASGDESENNGNFGEEAFILYADGQAEEGIWSYSAELRVGPGSFTEPAFNSTGDEFGIHKAWVGFDISDNHKITVGKSQVPFGWKTTNFWPGDMLIGGYGDQMDVGIKLDGSKDALSYSAAYYHQDDWSYTSADTMDDNKHWGASAGSKAAYRKVQTIVGDLNFEVAEGHKVGLSLQSGKLQDLSDQLTNEYDATWSGVDGDRETDGSHSAGVIYYKGKFDQNFVNAQVIKTKRELPDDYVAVTDMEQDQESTRYALTLGRSSGNWTYYVDATWAQSDTKGDDSKTYYGYAPGVKYNYGPGWIYAEYLTSDGYVGRDGNVGEYDSFNALYLTIDFYF